VIVAYFAGNDLLDAGKYETYRRSGLSWIEYQQLEAGLYRSSLAVQTLRYGLPLLFPTLPPIEAPTVPRAEPESGPAPAPPTADYRYPIVQRLGQREVPLAFSDHYLAMLTASRADIERSRNFAAIAAALLDLKRSAEAVAARVLVVYLPSKERVYLPRLSDPEHWARALFGVGRVERARGGLLEIGRQPATPELVLAHHGDQAATLADYAAGAGIAYLDLTPAFEAAADEGTPLWYTADTHWNQQGHELAARTIADYLSRAASGYP
jgi:hypothetical protein